MDFIENGLSLNYNWHGHPWHEMNGHDIYQIKDAQDAFVVNLCAVAALTWVLYDMILCFEQEVSLVWRRWRERRGRHSRRIYVLVRYLSILNLAKHKTEFESKLVRNSGCNAWHYILVINATIITLLPDAMVLIRINAVYGWDFTTLLTCTSLFLVQIATGLGVGVLAVLTTGTSPSIGFPTTGCPLGQPKYHPIITLAAWIPSVVAEGIYFLMMLNTFVHVLQDLDLNGRAGAESLLQVRRLVPTMVAFISHGASYFFIAITTKIVNAIVVVSVSGCLRGFGIPLMMALYPVLVTRTYLSMVAYLHAKPNCTVVHIGDQDIMIMSSSSSLVRPHIESGPITFAVHSSYLSPELGEGEY